MDILKNLYVILHLPKRAGNVGSVARVMKNFGVYNLRLITSKKILQTFEARKMAVHADDILSDADVFPNIESAVADLNVLIGTTGKKHKETPERLNLRDLGKILKLLEKNRIGILFGPEDRGLSGDELSFCNFVITIPTSKDYPSLNLSHSVAVILYEIFCQTNDFEPYKRILAKKESLDRMYGRMKEHYLEIGFLDKINPDRIMKVIKTIYDRALLNEREVRI
ncbi:MAG: RNA methyltransferase, partial [Proteobacteria bacterium]|nr:RNA methyltransferase [Pseudomonadota bacterium]